jgi:hypothetical protein
MLLLILLPMLQLPPALSPLRAHADVHPFAARHPATNEHPHQLPSLSTDDARLINYRGRIFATFLRSW